MNQVYYVSKGTLKIANKQYTSVKNDYEMTLNGESTIIPCEDSCDVPMVQCDFVSIGDLENKPKDTIVGKNLMYHGTSWTSIGSSCNGFDPNCFINFLILSMWVGSDVGFYFTKLR